MERRVRGNSHARCETGEKVESGAVAPLRPYLSLSWRPRDLTQRKGRIERQGNQNEKVHVCRYVTEACVGVQERGENLLCLYAAQQRQDQLSGQAV